MKRVIRKAVRALGFDIVRYPKAEDPVPLSDISAEDRLILREIAEYTMTSIERQIALVQAVRYIVRRGIPGSFVECGVWRGGSAMAVALALQQEGVTNRDLYLFDTFEGMSPPTDADKTADGTLAKTHLESFEKGIGYWCYASFEEVHRNLRSTGYPIDRVHLVKGPVEETLPAHSPSSPFALLRLDTDWYESTRHELTHLIPLLQRGGIVIVDDYGHWLGCRKAVDEYVAGLQYRPYLHRIDYTGRLWIKE